MLKDGAEHVLDNNGWRRVRDKTRLFMKLLREEVHSEIAVLAGLCRCSDTNDLAGTALKHQEVTNTDVVARDGDGLWRSSASLDITYSLRHSVADAGGTTLALLFLNDYFLALVLRCERVENAVSCLSQGRGGKSDSDPRRRSIPFLVCVLLSRTTSDSTRSSLG